MKYAHKKKNFGWGVGGGGWQELSKEWRVHILQKKLKKKKKLCSH